MRNPMRNRIAAILLIFAFLLACSPAGVTAADTEGFCCEKTATPNGDGTYSISLRAFQTGSVPAADIVMVLDVTGSMENSTPIPANELDGAKDYYIRYVRVVKEDGKDKRIRVNVRVHNTASPGEEPAWFGQLEENGPQTQVTPGDGQNGTYQFYTGAMDALRAAATDFVHSIAQNAVQYEADHRVAVVEFSSPEPKGAGALCTHATQPDPYYANILTGDGTASGALMSAKDSEQTLTDVFASLNAAGPTYSDDAMTQAKQILSGSTASRRVVIFFTDGGPGSYGWEYDNDSTALLTANGAIAAAAQMKQNGTQIYTIGVFNEENLAGETGQKNRTYLSLVSSNYPDAESMDVSGTQQANNCCSIGDLHMDLSGAFAGISAALGEPVHSAQVCDTVSKYFYLTDAQRQALLEAYPQAQIIENDDGTTTVSLDAVDFPPVAIHANGEVVDENDAGIFKLTFDVTARDGFLGGDGVSTNSGRCGVFADGLQIGQFAAPSVDVPVDETALGDLLTVTPQSLYTDQTLSAEQLYVDRSQEEAADFATLTYTVTDPDGAAFTSRVMTTAGTYPFTVTVTAQIGERTYTQKKTVNVTVTEDTVERLELVTAPTKTQYYVRQQVELDGMEICAHLCSGKTVPLTAEDVSVSPESLTTPGTKTVTLSFGGASTTFLVTVLEYAPTLVIARAPDKITYFTGDSPDLTGLTLVYTDAYNDAHTLTSGYSFTPKTFSVAGTQTVTVTYRGLSASFDVTVKELKAVSAVIESMPENTSFVYKRSPDFKGLAVRVQYNDGHDEVVRDLSQMKVEPASAARVRRGPQTFRVTTQGVSATFTMQVRLTVLQWIILILLFGWIWY